MSKKAKPKPEVHEYQAEMQKLLEILVHSLYTEREIFLRELVSNASDALSKVQLTTLTEEKVLDKDTELQITISLDEEQRKIVIEDSGCGMTKEELVENLGTIANSGTLKYLEQLKTENKSAENLIGQFGVGFYSVFMVADRVELTTRSWQEDAKAWQWSSEGGGQYEIIPVDFKQRGTRVTVFLKEDAKEFCSEWRLESIIKKYSNDIFLGIPLTTTQREGSFYFQFEFKNKISTAILVQHKLYSNKRLIKKMGMINKEDFIKLKEALNKLIFAS